MPVTATAYRPSSRALIILGAGVGLLVAAAIYLWARYGIAVFHEMIVAGIALCF
jgi:hypothetical protein